jgi:hypothetical protein
MPSEKTVRMGDRAKPLAVHGRRFCCIRGEKHLADAIIPVGEVAHCYSRLHFAGEGTFHSQDSVQGRHKCVALAPRRLAVLSLRTAREATPSEGAHQL